MLWKERNYFLLADDPEEYLLKSGGARKHAADPMRQTLMQSSEKNANLP
jgi:hypothetical protein